MGCCCSKRYFEEENGTIGYRLINGRRYHTLSESAYFGANDDEEAYRLSRYHDAIKEIWGGLFNSPVEEKLSNGARVIDIGCGSGIWILDMAQRYPKSKFVGIDISPILPTENLPPNVKFIQYNVLDGIPCEDSSFDLVHQKFLVGAYTESQWEEKVIPEIIRLARPDGWIELLEGDIIISNGSVTQRVARALHDFMKSRGLYANIGKEVPRMLERTNAFSEIRNQHKIIKLGKKHGKSSEETLRFFTSGLTSSRAGLSAWMNVIPEHYDALVETVSIEAEKYSTQFDQYRVCAHKKI
ncbi:10678_t:CDS:2 [Ambispora leptoticha]|uniref:10678_t:CDS:1 n=1 Tax=Ambispora leptoticha TaxID=144679 RepID=A0A9N9FHM3_9GLOM|nr:10678_t:CDS:2 [Ambispora leptoticha]